MLQVVLSWRAPVLRADCLRCSYQMLWKNMAAIPNVPKPMRVRTGVLFDGIICCPRALVVEPYLQDDHTRTSKLNVTIMLTHIYLQPLTRIGLTTFHNCCFPQFLYNPDEAIKPKFYTAPKPTLGNPKPFSHKFS